MSDLTVDGIIGQADGRTFSLCRGACSEDQSCGGCGDRLPEGLLIGEWLLTVNGMEYLTVFYCRDCAVMIEEWFVEVFGEHAAEYLS